MSVLYLDPPPGVVRVPQPRSGRFTQGPGAWGLSAESADAGAEGDAAGATVSNPPFLGLFTVPTATWSGSAVLGGLFRWPYADWNTRLSTPGSTPETGDVPASGVPAPPAQTKIGADV
jgi:hypothetical protein